MIELSIITIVGGVLVLGIIYVHRLEPDRSLRLWTWAFVAMYAGGSLSYVDPQRAEPWCARSATRPNAPSPLSPTAEAAASS